MKISHFGIKLSIAFLLGLVLISYAVYWNAISSLSDHMTSLVEASDHLANGETFHSAVHSMLMNTGAHPDRKLYLESHQKADDALLQLQGYLGLMTDRTQKDMLTENTTRMAERYAVFRDYTVNINHREASGYNDDERQKGQHLFDNIFTEYKKLHQHHTRHREVLKVKTQSIKTSIQLMLVIQIIIAFIIGALVILYFDRTVLKVFDLTEKLALHDRLTGLYNRHGLDRIVLEMEKSRGKNQIGYGVILMDIDHFKQFNDNFGHPAGDHLLVGLADLLLKTVRLQDRVVRFGGEEFLILLSRTDIKGTRQAAQKICNIVAGTPFDLMDGKSPKRVTVSIGYAAVDHDRKAFSELVEIADQRLYKAKKSGRNMAVGVEA